MADLVADVLRVGWLAVGFLLGLMVGLAAWALDEWAGDEESETTLPADWRRIETTWRERSGYIPPHREDDDAE